MVSQVPYFASARLRTREQDFWKDLNHHLNGLVGHSIYTKYFWIYLPKPPHMSPFGTSPRLMSPTPGKHQRLEVGPSNSPQYRKVPKEKGRHNVYSPRVRLSAVGGARSFPVQKIVPTSSLRESLGVPIHVGRVLSEQSRDWSM